ncbi:MAG: bifunctional 4-hydroxy-2-oxoglutarate aldolase/2-dehydro-3-deoxy-phosphogluconate aldolase [Acidobacteriia bacterium]|nr:bifunctional 4-hydroxy-2-oxoglutarate aldolase/2-dehydro-3-deoxy-phosphogluconate aldolase [Terriglobia bacterium]
MTKQEVRHQITQVGIVPVVRAASAKQAMMAIEAVCLGGIPIAEITMTVPGAVDLIREVARCMGSDVLVGAGTVLDAATARECADAGAQFLVSPGLDCETVDFAKSRNIVMMAGALTPTEVMNAWKAGADFVKIFPCGELGGANYIKALRGPLPQIPMVPTGGVNLETAADFIRAGAVALGVGGELISSAALNAGNTHLICECARRFIEVVQNARSLLDQKRDEAGVAWR